MIRNVVLHLHGELPMKADIESLPTAGDAGLLCTNLRTMEGRKPISTEFLDSVFLIPYNVIRFIEIPRESIDQAGIGPTASRLPQLAAGHVLPDPDGVTSPPPSAAREPVEEDEALEELEPDAELLRRIRDA